jgi:mono/diheme cytochrome c family protein
MWRGVLSLLALTGLTQVHAAPDGAAIFAQQCAACHQADGQGTVGLAPALKGPHWQRLGSDRAYLPQVLVHGLSGLIVVNGERHVGSMPAFGSQLDDDSLAAVANHLQGVVQARSDAAYTAEDIRAARAAGGSPPKSRERRAQALK